MTSKHFNDVTMAIEWSNNLAIVINSVSAHDMALDHFSVWHAKGFILVVGLNDHAV